MDDRPQTTEPPNPPGTIFTAHRRTQAVVCIVSILCIVLVWDAASWLGIPPVPKVDGSLLAQPQWPLAILATYVLLLASVAVGTILAGWTWFFSGLFVGALTLVTLAIRCGAMRFVLFDAASHGDVKGIFLRLLLEQCLLFAVLAIVWGFFWRRFLSLMPAGEEEPASARFNVVGAVAVQIIASGALILMLAPTDAKKQVLLSAFAGAFLGVMLAEYLFPSRRAVAWYWLGSFVAGAVGYVAAYTHAVPWTVGTAVGPLANLAHPLPLDYAGAGILGALLGYWSIGARPHVPFSWRRAVAVKEHAGSTAGAVQPIPEKGSARNRT
jgi:hypothetical protein